MFRQPFHLVEFSPWPFIRGIGGLSLTFGLVIFFHYKILRLLFLALAILFLCSFQWWRDVVREGTVLGFHTVAVTTGLKIGMILFIISEVIFFVSFFWAFFHRRLSPTAELGCSWPPVGVSALNPFQLPLLNTVVLLASGVTVTFCHHRIINKNLFNRKIGLILTIILGLYFTFLQVGEYQETRFSIADRVFGAVFFVATGFHGLHVIIGSLFLLTCLLRLYLNHFSSRHHFGFEAASWYWHFVDVVWIFLYCNIYIWGS
jgi:cytochrome c oxidase subunit 3